MFNTLSSAHIEFIIIQYYIDRIKPGQLYSMLVDENAFEKYGIEPVKKLSKNYFYKVLKDRIPETTIATVTTEWALALLNEPLSRGRSRIRALTEIVNDTLTPVSVRVSAIREIGQIAGDDDAAIKALKESGKTDVKVEVSLQDEMKSYFSKEDDVA